MIICMIFRASIVPAASKSLPHITTTLKGKYYYPLFYKRIQEVKIKELGPNHTPNEWEKPALTDCKALSTPTCHLFPLRAHLIKYLDIYVWEAGVSWLSSRPESGPIVCHGNLGKHLATLGLSFFICKMGKRILVLRPHQVAKRTK